MSRYTHKTDKYEFCFGWDPPLRYFFLDVYDRQEPEEPIFDNLARKNPAMTIDEIRAVCRDYGWEFPATYEVKLLRDRHEDLVSKGVEVERPVPGQN